uniref:Paired domain-containing protein n=1 Tax=Panagrolaimus sp. JU765 TaxID=591449 RepID=A0AC34Q659_9BILA
MKVYLVGESARNRFGRPYISGRPLLTCDRQKIIYLFKNGLKKIEIARCLGITHSCVSKVIRKFEETGTIEQEKQSRTASCACPGESPYHNPSICRHLRYSPITRKTEPKPKKFSIDWILSDSSREEKFTQNKI